MKSPTRPSYRQGDGGPGSRGRAWGHTGRVWRSRAGRTVSLVSLHSGDTPVPSCFSRDSTSPCLSFLTFPTRAFTALTRRVVLPISRDEAGEVLSAGPGLPQTRSRCGCRSHVPGHRHDWADHRTGRSSLRTWKKNVCIQCGQELLADKVSPRPLGLCSRRALAWTTLSSSASPSPAHLPGPGP